jgi:hypothetical protein
MASAVRTGEIRWLVERWERAGSQGPYPVTPPMVSDLLERLKDREERVDVLEEQADRYEEQLCEKRSQALVPLRELAESVLPLYLCRQMSDEDLLREVGSALAELAELRRVGMRKAA